MRTGIEQARIELAKWEKRVADDAAALKAAEDRTEHMRQQLAASTKATASLRHAVDQWDAMQTPGKHERDCDTCAHAALRESEQPCAKCCESAPGRPLWSPKA